MNINNIALNNCLKKLNDFNNINLKKIAPTILFEDFQQIICKKDTIKIAKDFINSIQILDEQIIIKPKIILVTYIIKFYKEELGLISSNNTLDDMLINIADKLIDSFDMHNIPNICTIIKEFDIIYNTWSMMDKDRSIEQMITSYYHMSEHIKKIESDSQLDFEQSVDMITELKKERQDILKNIQLIDKHFDVEYLKTNYIMMYNTIQKSWEQIKVSLQTNMMTAYYNMICDDIKNGDMFSCFNLIKEIGERMVILCPEKNKLSFFAKFNDDNLQEMLSENNFNARLIIMIIFMIDFIINMDAPVNDNTNKIWKESIYKLINNDNFSCNFPKILISIQEHIDIIYSMIAKLNN